MGGRRGIEGWECVGFVTTNKPGRRNTMILGILNMRLCFFITPRAYDLLQSSHSTGCFILHLIHGYIPFYLTIDIIYDISLSLLVMYNNDGGKGGAWSCEAHEVHCQKSPITVSQEAFYSVVK